MSGLGLLSNYNYESDPSDTEDTEIPSASKTQVITYFIICSFLERPCRSEIWNLAYIIRST